jgi:hypothetical protein
MLSQWFLNLPYIQRTRRNHALEHATVHVLARQLKNTRLMGHSSDSGFILFADAPLQTVENAVNEALRRMQNGQSQLAIHPGCGTSRITAGLLTSLVAILIVGGKSRRQASGQLSLLVLLMMVALMIAEPLGLILQKYVTTDGDPANLEILSITESKVWLPLRAKPVPMYTIKTHSS